MNGEKLLPPRTSRWKKYLFELYFEINSRGNGKSTTFYRIFIVAFFVKKIHLVSIAVFADSFVQNELGSGVVANLLGWLRVDMLIVRLGYQLELTVLFASLVFLNVFMKFLVLVELSRNKRTMIHAITWVIHFNSLVINFLLRIPIIQYGTVVAISLLNLDVKNNEFIGFTKLSFTLSGLMCITLAVFIPSLILDVILGNQPVYHKRSITRVHSIVQVREITVIFIVSILKYNVSSYYTNYIFFACACFIISSYWYYLPYFSNLLNFIGIFAWVSVVLSCVLIFITKSLTNPWIFELNFLFLLVAIGVLVYTAVIRRVEQIKKLRFSSNPFIHELIIRCYLFDVTGELTEEDKEYIFKHFKFANENFFSFQLQYVFESLIIKCYLKDLELSVMKLIKVNLSQCQPLLITQITLQKSTTFGLLGFESNYYLYSIFKKSNQVLRITNPYFGLIKYFTKFSECLSLDFEVTNSLINLASSIKSPIPTHQLDLKINNVGRLLFKFQDSAKKFFEKFGMEEKFTKFYRGFLKDVLENKNSEKKLKRFEKISQLNLGFSQEENDLDIDEPFLIISGWTENIGTIVYANPAINALLETTRKGLIGTSFSELIPPPFDTLHNMILFRFLFEKNSTELQRDHLFLLDLKKNCIEVAMELRLAFYKCQAYFVASFKKIIPSKKMILFSMQGEIFSFSKGVKEMLNFKMIYECFPEIQRYFDRYANETFEYSEENVHLFMQKRCLQIGNVELCVLYISEPILPDPIYSQINLQKGNEKFTCTIKEKKIFHTETLKKAPKEIASFDETTRILKAKKSIKILNIAILACSTLGFGLTLAIVLIIFQLISTLSVNSVIFDTGLMRYLSISILTDTRSLDLLSQNYTLNYNETDYKGFIQGKLNKLEVLLDQYKDIYMPILDEHKYFFDEALLEDYKVVDGVLMSKTVTLYNAVKDLTYNAQILANNKDFQSAEVQEIIENFYLNIPILYSQCLNLTVMNIMNYLGDSVNRVFKILEYIQLLCILPPILLLFISLWSFYKIEKSNRKFWFRLQKLKFAKLAAKRNTLIERLYIIHECEYIPEENPERNSTKHYKCITILPIIKLLIFVLISVAFYFSIIYGQELELKALFKIQLEHTNFGGMRRMLSPFTHFWGREAFLESSGKLSYISLVPISQIANSSLEMYKKINKFVFTENYLMNTLNNNVQSQYSFSEYLHLMKGKACDIITNVPNCSQSIVAFGLDTGIKMYLSELENAVTAERIEGFSQEGIQRIEKYSKVIENSCIFGLQVYSNYTDTLIADLKNKMSINSFAFLVLTIIWCAFVLHKLARKLYVELNQKMNVSSIFE